MAIKECEIWKDIKGYEGLYQISNYGRVCIKNSRVNYDKCFAVLADAIAFRNEVMNGGSTV